MRGEGERVLGGWDSCAPTLEVNESGVEKKTKRSDEREEDATFESRRKRENGWLQNEVVERLKGEYYETRN